MDAGHRSGAGGVGKPPPEIFALSQYTVEHRALGSFNAKTTDYLLGESTRPRHWIGPYPTLRRLSFASQPHRNWKRPSDTGITASAT